MADLRDKRGLSIQLVCTGAKLEPGWSNIERRVRELRLEPQVKFLGYVSESDLRAVYRQARFLILPSLFEADSCPIYEAWAEGVPVASSNHTALPEQVGDAGLLFDALDVGQIGNAVEKLATDEDARKDLVERGHRRVNDFSWERTAMAFRAVYRRAAGVTLNEEDRWLLSWDWMKQPGLTRPQS
jgi:glycosyltransferase involved in cell wall biosynthesis